MFSKQVAARLTAAVAAFTVGGGALAAMAPAASAGSILECMNTHTHVSYIYSGRCPRGYRWFFIGQTGPAGANGKDGVPQPTVSGSLMVSGASVPNYTTNLSATDTPPGETWATASFTRSYWVALVSPVGTWHCQGSGSGYCYQYLAGVTDSDGSWNGLQGATSPDNGSGNSGACTTSCTFSNNPPWGTFSGGMTAVSFYADELLTSSNAVTPSTSATINYFQPTWIEEVFPSGTLFSSPTGQGATYGANNTTTGPNVAQFSWSFDSLATCETWVLAGPQTAGSGDISGTSACSSSHPAIKAAKATTMMRARVPATAAHPAVKARAAVRGHRLGVVHLAGRTAALSMDDATGAGVTAGAGLNAGASAVLNVAASAGLNAGLMASLRASA